MSHDLNGRLILISGAGGGLGPVAAAHAVAAGAEVALWDRSADTLNELRTALAGGPGRVAHTDSVELLDPQATQEGVERLLAATGRLDAVWHLVGGYRGGVAYEDEPLDDFELLINLGIRTTVHVARSTAAALMNSEHGRFLTISAPIATKPSGMSAAYSIAKAGSDAAVLALADRFKGSQATANIIVVNAIATPAMLAAEPDKDWSRFTTAAALADAMVYVTSDAAGTMNGQHLRLVGTH